MKGKIEIVIAQESLTEQSLKDSASQTVTEKNAHQNYVDNVYSTTTQVLS